MAKAGKKAAKGARFKGWVAASLKFGTLIALLGLMVTGIFVAIARGELESFEDLKASPNGQMIRVRAADGTVIQTLGPSFGRWIPVSEIPHEMKDAMVAVEDRRFYYHPGIDPYGLARAVFVSLTDGGGLRATSTITQQLARNVYLNNNRDIGRKLREMILAMAMETKFSKEQILELYLNKVYFGGGAYGVDAASRRFFDHGAEDISLAEATIIAGLVKAPSRYSPTADAKAAIGRAGVVLEVMQDAGMITPAEAASVHPAKVRLAPEPKQDSVRYFTDWALPQLEGLIDETEKPIDVWTTLDLGMQRAASSAIRAGVPRGAQGALVSIDRDGAVRAMVGGTDYATSNYNRAVTALRQPGSAWKVFVYLAALEGGYRPEDKVVDEAVTIDGWSPRNSSGSYSGEITLRTAFAYSKNTVAAKLGQDIGTSSIASMARRFGISTPIATTPAMVLGSSDTRVLDMTQAFASIAARGKSVTPYAISKVTTIDGDVIYQHKPARQVQLVEDYVAGAMTDLMQSAVATGTGRAAAIGRPVAGKTGTTSSNKDGWFLGFSSGLTTGVWMGRDDARAVGNLQGGTAPAAAWANYMRTAVARRPVENFDTDVTFPERLEDEEMMLGEDGGEILVDENGMPIEGAPGDAGDIPSEMTEPEPLDEAWINQALGRSGKEEGADTPKPPQRNGGSKTAPPPPR